MQSGAHPSGVAANDQLIHVRLAAAAVRVLQADAVAAVGGEREAQQ